MIIESEKNIYDSSVGKYVCPEWVLDTDKGLIIHTDSNLKATERWFHKDFIGYHLKYRAEYCPDLLRNLVNEGKIIEYLEELEIKVTDAINNQVEIWENESKEYQIANESGNLYEVQRIANLFTVMARKSIFDVMIYV